jgi:hypothetical protein
MQVRQEERRRYRCAARLRGRGKGSHRVAPPARGGPHSKALSLDKAAVETDARGYIKVDDQLRTKRMVRQVYDCRKVRIAKPAK